MNGPEHYLAAEQLLAEANRDVSRNYEVDTGERKADVIAMAQVHATLAHVAAGMDAAMVNANAGIAGDVAMAWQRCLA